MAVTVLWDDGTKASWSNGTDWTQQGARLSYLIEDADGREIATIPDFGVRYLTTEPPNIESR